MFGFLFLSCLLQPRGCFCDRFYAGDSNSSDGLYPLSSTEELFVLERGVLFSEVNQLTFRELSATRSFQMWITMTNQQLADLFLQWKEVTNSKITANSLRYSLSCFVNWLDKQKLLVNDLTPIHIMDYTMFVASSDIKQSTKSHRMMAVRSFWRWRQQRGEAQFDISVIPTMPSYDKTPFRPVTEAEYRRIIDSFNPVFSQDIRDRSIVSMLYDTGVRRSELVSLNVGNIDTVLMKGVVRTSKRKNHFRTIFWQRDTNQFLYQWLTVREALLKRSKNELTDALYVPMMKSSCNQRLKPAAITTIVRNIKRRLGIETQLSPHSFRHSFGKRTVGAMHIKIAADLLGHKSVNTTAIYQQIDDHELEKQYRRHMKREETIEH